MLTDRDRQRLTGVHPDLVAAYEAAAVRAEQAGTPIFVVYGVRTAEEQRALYAEGRTCGGHIVTYCDGVTKKSDHQVAADGFGHAIDFAFVPTKTRPNAFAADWPWRVVAGYAVDANAVGRVKWGGTFKQPADLDHLQLIPPPDIA